MLEDPSLWVLIVVIILALGFGIVNGGGGFLVGGEEAERAFAEF